MPHDEPAHLGAFVPEGFVPPAPPTSDDFDLEPLGPRHNRRDLAAWSSSIGHIRATPGFDRRSWPRAPMSEEENLADLVAHEADFRARRGFTYSVLEPVNKEVIGCVYLYPPRRPGFDVDVASWVRASRAELDRPLHDLVCEWLAASWPWSSPDYDARR